MAERPKYRRALLKLSGEAFGGEDGRGLDVKSVTDIARRLAALHKERIQLAVVIGGGNIVRGVALRDTAIAPAVADTMGMLATVINGVALQDVLEGLKVETRLQSAIPVGPAAEPYSRRRCLHHLAKGRVVILAGGTGNPHFTTDTAAALRARELGADALLKATTVDGVYCSDPKKNPKARRYTRLTYDDVIHNDLRVMDANAVVLCRDAGIPILVFDLAKKGNIRRAVFGARVGTIVQGG